MMMKKPLGILLLSLTLLLLTSVPAFAATYNDTFDHWAEDAIEKWSQLEVIQGNAGLFRPDDGITRGEMALIIDRIMKYQDQAANTFLDLEDTWYTEAVLKLNAAGIMLGAHGLARPTDGIVREEAAVMIARATGLDTLYAEIDALPFEDGDQVSDWAYGPIAYLSANGYITDSPVNFRPQADITRAEVVTLLDNLIGKLWRSDGLYNAAIQGNAAVAAKKVMLLNSTIQGDLIIAGGGTEQVILQNTVISGKIINKSNAVLIIIPEGQQNLDSILFRDELLPVQQGAPVLSYQARDFSIDSDGRVMYQGGGDSLTGVDVSEHQADIDWYRVAEDGVDFAFIRLGYRGYTEGGISLDQKFARNMEGAAAAGLDVGVYFFSQAISEAEAREEAQFVINQLQDYDLDYPVVFDWETIGSSDARTRNISSAVLTDCAIAFCQEIEAAGYTPMIYLYGDLAYKCYNLPRLTDYDWWFAGYSATPEFYYDFRIWQYTSSGSVDGIIGRADLNICFRGY